MKDSFPLSVLHKNSRHGGVGAALLILLGCVLAQPHGNLLAVGTVPFFLVGMAVVGMGYLGALRRVAISGLLFWTVAVSARGILLFMAPGDDIYRYIWEGRVLGAGLNPYVLAPNDPQLIFLRDTLWAQVNHQGTTALYPPLTLWLFALLAKVSPTVWFFKIFFIAVDLAVCALLVSRFGAARSLLYAWNPLVLYAFAGGGHYDVLMIAALTLGWGAVDKLRPVSAAAWLVLGGSYKYVAGLLVLWPWLRGEQRGRVTVVAGAITALTFGIGFAVLPWPEGLWRIAPWEFVKWVRSAEFCPAWIDWLMGGDGRRWVWWAALGLALWSCLRLSRNFAVAAERFLAVLLLLSPAVHAWYFVWLMPWAVQTRNKGTMALGLSAFVYFWLQHKTGLGEVWKQSGLEWALLWLPFVVGFGWTEWERRKKVASES